MVDRRKCRSCKYRSHINATVVCNYILIEKKRRGCYTNPCDKYEKGDQIEERNF